MTEVEGREPPVRERRRWTRRPLELRVRFGDLDASHDPDLAGLGEGVSIDLGLGGLSLRTTGRMPAAVDPTVWFSLPDGTSVVVLARVVHAHREPDGGWTYRLMFLDVDDETGEALARWSVRDAG